MAFAAKLATLVLGTAVVLAPTTAFAQSSGGSSGGGSSGGGPGGASAVGSASTSSATGRAPTRSAIGNTNSGLRNQASPTTSPGGSSPSYENTEQSGIQLRDRAQPTTPSSPAPGDDRGRTTDVRRNADPGSAGLPARAETRRQEPDQLSGGGATRQGAVGQTMSECEAAWDAKTHMSKVAWRDTCKRTLTEPHL